MSYGSVKVACGMAGTILYALVLVLECGPLSGALGADRFVALDEIDNTSQTRMALSLVAEECGDESPGPDLQSDLVPGQDAVSPTPIAARIVHLSKSRWRGMGQSPITIPMHVARIRDTLQSSGIRLQI